MFKKYLDFAVIFMVMLVILSILAISVSMTYTYNKNKETTTETVKTEVYKVLDIRETAYCRSTYSNPEYRIVVVLEDKYGERKIIDVREDNIPESYNEDTTSQTAMLRLLVPGDIVKYSYGAGTFLVERINNAEEIEEVNKEEIK